MTVTKLNLTIQGQVALGVRRAVEEALTDEFLGVAVDGAKLWAPAAYTDSPAPRHVAYITHHFRPAPDVPTYQVRERFEAAVRPHLPEGIRMERRSAIATVFYERVGAER